MFYHLLRIFPFCVVDPYWVSRILLGFLFSYRIFSLESVGGKKKATREKEMIPVGKAMFLAGVVRLGPGRGQVSRQGLEHQRNSMYLHGQVW